MDLLINCDTVPETQDILKSFDIHVGPLPHKMKSIDATGVRKSVSEKCRKRIMDLYHYDLELYENFHGRAYVTTTPADAGAKWIASFPGPSKKPGSENHIPKKLFLYWRQGWSNAPDLVRRCAETWQTHNSTWDIHLLDVTSIAKQIELPLPALSDIIRIGLLKRYGGVWADATLWCVRPLDDWTEPVCAHSGFFAYDKPSPDRSTSSWFLATSADCRIIDLWHSAVQHLLTKTLTHARFRWVFDNQEKSRLLKAISKLCMGYISLRFRYGYLLITSSEDPEDENYFWFYYLFVKLLEQNSEFQRLWASTPRISARNPMLLRYAGLLKPITERTESIIRNRFSNVHKLTRRESFPEDIGGTVLDALYRYSQG